MARVSIDIPEHFDFSIELPIYISHINRGDHLGNDSLISFLNEARVHYMAAHGVDEYLQNGYLLVNADLAVNYLSEGRYGETLKIEVVASEFHKYGCDVAYRVTEASSGRAIAVAKTAHLLMDPGSGKPMLAPPSLRQKLGGRDKPKTGS